MNGSSGPPKRAPPVYNPSPATTAPRRTRSPRLQPDFTKLIISGNVVCLTLKRELKERTLPEIHEKIDDIATSSTPADFLTQLEKVVNCPGFNQTLIAPIRRVIKPVFLNLFRCEGHITSKPEFVNFIIQHCDAEAIEIGLIRLMMREWRTDPNKFMRTTSTLACKLQSAHLVQLGFEKDATAPERSNEPKDLPFSMQEAQAVMANWGSYKVHNVMCAYGHRQAGRLRNSMQDGRACARRFVSDLVILKLLCPMLALKGQGRASVALIRAANDVQETATSRRIDDATWAVLKDVCDAITKQVTCYQSI